MLLKAVFEIKYGIVWMRQIGWFVLNYNIFFFFHFFFGEKKNNFIFKVELDQISRFFFYYTRSGAKKREMNRHKMKGNTYEKKKSIIFSRSFKKTHEATRKSKEKKQPGT